MPQLDNVFPTLTVSENLHVGAQGAPHGASGATRWPRSSSSSLSCATAGGSARARSRVASADYLALGRALVGRPTLLLLDEPSAGLSPQAMDAVFAELEGIRDREIGIVMVEQNARRALSLSARAYVLDMGQNAHEGTGAELLVDPRVAELYLGSMTSAPPPRPR